jgi:hypothetical protein
MPRGLKVSRPLIVNMIPFVNISDFLKWKNTYIMIFRVAHHDTSNDLVFHFNVQGEINS